ncbi:MAG: substrate-binding domain-containing protein [Nitrospira sp.]
MVISRQVCLSLTLTVLGPFMTTCLVSATPVDAPANETITIDAEIRPYAKVSGVSGTINSIGSDTLNNLITLWAEGFRKQYPNVKIQVEGKGSSTAPPALIENTAQLGPMSRTMKSSEIDAFEAKFGYPPTAYPVAVDALALFVNKDNPVAGLTMAEVDALFSKSRRQGAPHGHDPLGTTRP